MLVLYQITLPYACYGAVVENDIVIHTAPIASWMLNKPWKFCYKWLLGKKANVIVAEIY